MHNINPRDAWKILIRPERQSYALSNLGMVFETFDKNDCFRKDFDFKNRFGLKILCSLFIPVKKSQANLDIEDFEDATLDCPCVISCHS